MRRIRLWTVLLALLCLTGTSCAAPFTARTTLHSEYDPDRPVARELVTAMLEAAFSMPTGGDQRALIFYVVTERETMQAMKGGNPYAQAMDTAPCAIVVAADTASAWYGELLEMDAGLAAGAMLIQASEDGLSTCVLSIAPQTERIQAVRTALGMEEHLVPILMVAVGYPREDVRTGASVTNWSDAQVYWK